MKKKITLGLAALVVMLIGTAGIMDPGGKAGYTGSPGEGTCADAGCHTGSAINSGGGSVVISSPGITNGKYAPGQKYTVSVTVTQTGRPLFGFDFEALDASGKSVGMMMVTNSTEMAIGQKTVGSNTRKCMTHKLNGGKTTGSHAFTFDWTAPSPAVGNITMYATGNAANGTGNSSGDLIYKTSLVLSPDNTSIDNLTIQDDLKVYSPGNNELVISYTGMSNSLLSGDLISINGQLVANLFTNEDSSQGTFNRKISLNGSIASGVYLFKLKDGNALYYRKVFVL